MESREAEKDGEGVYGRFVCRLFNPTTIRKTKRTLSNMEVSIIEKENKSNNSNSNGNGNTLRNMADVRAFDLRRDTAKNS